MSNNIAEAIMGNLDPEVAISREALKAAVMRQIMCPRSGVVLDIRSAVYFRVVAPDGQSAAEVVDGPVWDGIKDQIIAACLKRNIELEVIDGRTVNAKGYGKTKRS